MPMKTSIGFVALVVQIPLAECASVANAPAAGSTVQCPGGTSRIVMQCGNVAGLKRQVIDATRSTRLYAIVGRLRSVATRGIRAKTAPEQMTGKATAIPSGIRIRSPI